MRESQALKPTEDHSNKQSKKQCDSSDLDGLKEESGMENFVNVMMAYGPDKINGETKTEWGRILRECKDLSEMGDFLTDLCETMEMEATGLWSSYKAQNLEWHSRGGLHPELVKQQFE